MISTVYILICEGELVMSADGEGGGNSLGSKNSFFDTVVCHTIDFGWIIVLIIV